MMGNLHCDRAGCEHIMCERMSHEHGYLCESCFEELLNVTTFDVAGFMKSRKPAPLFSQVRETFCNGTFPKMKF
jgi:hypothetical protein